MDLDLWLERLLDFGQTAPLPREEGLRYQGESDRSLWRPESGKLDFSIPILKNLFQQIHIPQTSTEYPFLLHCSGTFDDAPDDAHRAQPIAEFCFIHPENQYSEGEYILKTEYGELHITLRHDPKLRHDVIRAPAAHIPGIMDILPDMVAKYTGTAILDGIACTLKALG